MSPAQAAEKLTPPEKVEWLLAELITLRRDRKFHLWVEDYAMDEAPDFLRAVAVIAEVARPVNPKIADVIRWTVDRGLQAREGTREEAPWDVVPEIWIGTWEDVYPFHDATVERWPKALDPFAAPEPPAWERKVVAPKKKGPRALPTTRSIRSSRRPKTARSRRRCSSGCAWKGTRSRPP